LFSKSLDKRNKDLQSKLVHFNNMKVEVDLYKQYSLYLEKQCRALKDTNFKLVQKLQSSITFILDYAMSEDQG
jgi:hypothetical protein